MLRIALIIMTLFAVAGCKKELPPAELAKLQGGTTTVVVFGYCAPAASLFGELTRTSLTVSIGGKTVGTMKTCSYGRFTTPSGYWAASLQPALGFPTRVMEEKYRPGETKYLHMVPEFVPTGHVTYIGRWVSKAQADQAIARIKGIGQLF